MPRQNRLSLPGTVHHIITRGLNRQALFLDNKDRNEFMSRFFKALQDTESRCYAWCLMSNHVHLMVRCGPSSLSDLMRSPLTGYAVYFNRRHRRVGYLYQNRYHSTLCQEEPYFLELVRYIHLNPVRAGVVRALADLATYPWTGHRTIIGRSKVDGQDADEVLARFSNRRGPAIQGYLSFLGAGLKLPLPDFSGGGLRRSAGGWAGLQELKRNKDFWRGDARILGDGDFVNRVLEASEERLAVPERMRQAGWTLPKIISHACAVSNIPPENINRRGRRNAVAKAKALASYWATHLLRASGEETARFLGITRQAVLANARKGKALEKTENIKLLC